MSHARFNIGSDRKYCCCDLGDEFETLDEANMGASISVIEGFGNSADYIRRTSLKVPLKLRNHHYHKSDR